MPVDRPPAPSSASVVMAAVVSGAVVIAVLGTFLPDLIGIEGTPALVLRLVFYAVGAIDVAIALWLRGRINKARQADRRSGNSVQHTR